MDTKILHGELIPEISQWIHGTAEWRQRLDKVFPVLTHPALRLELEQHCGELEVREPRRQWFVERYELPSVIEPNKAVLGLCEELESCMSSQSGSDPRQLDFRILSSLRRHAHLEMAGFRTMLPLVRLMDANEANSRMEAFLAEEISWDQVLSELTPSVLQWASAETASELEGTTNSNFSKIP